MAADAQAAGAGAADAAAAAAPASPELLAAAHSNHIDALAAMLDAGADCNGRRAADGMTALHEAAAAGALAAAQLLLERGADVGAALQVAADNKHFGWQPLHFAAAGGHVPLIELLLARGADAAAAGRHGRTPFLEAAWCGHTGAVRAFLDAGMPVDAHRDVSGATALHLAAEKARADVVALLLERGADVRAFAGTRETPLHRLFRRQHESPESVEQILQALLVAGADVNALDSSGQAPLHKAARYRDSPVQTLLAAGACLEAVARWNSRRPLHYASDYANLGGVEALLAVGADPHARVDNGATALHLACGADAVYSEKPHVIATLLAAGADARAVDKAGQEPLHYLATCDQYLDGPTHEARASEAVAALVAAGADLSAVDSSSNTPLMAALHKDPRNETVLLALARHTALYKCRDCADAARQRVGLQGLVVGAAAEAARLRREQASWQEERAALEQQQAALEGERVALQQQQVAWQEERTALQEERAAWQAARAALVATHKQTVAASSAQQDVGAAPKRPRNRE